MKAAVSHLGPEVISSRATDMIITGRHINLLRAILLVSLMALMGKAPLLAESSAPLPDGVRAVWDLNRAYREKTPTRERVCLNGLWRWQPARGATDAVPAGTWGHFKVPGCWPGITDYMQKDSQTVHFHPAWKGEKLGEITAAWYEREITVPAEWTGRRIELSAEYVNSFAAVYVDGKKAGEIRFPGGEVDLSAACRPGGTHSLALLVAAMPLEAVLLSYTDSASAREVKGSVERRGLCGDVFLSGSPAGARIGQVNVDTSTRRSEITISAALEGLAADSRYALRAEIREDGRAVEELTSKVFQGGELEDGRVSFTEKWRSEKLWDIHTPQNMCQLSLSLLEAGGKALDTALPVRFGFRELWIDGRDFYLNGSRIFLSAVPLDNAQVSAALAAYAGARETLERLKSFGINFVYTHNYGCEPGSHLSFAEILRAADDVGMLVSLSQPHFSHYDWKTAGADHTNGYARHAEHYVRAALNHPSVVAYSMSHNATGYNDDMNPDLMDGISDHRDTWSLNNSRLALRAEAIVKRLDPGRIVYHHASGNLGSMHTTNFYPNFTPIQEMSDWFEHWATSGVKPVFTCEYGAPFTWDWSMYRGWHNGERSFGSARVPWEFCFAEWNSQFLGDRAFRISEEEKSNLRWEALQFRAGKLWHRWDYPHEIGSRAFDDRQEVFSMYLTDNWRAFRTWGVSANSPWEYGHFWKPRRGLDSRARNRKESLSVDWENLQRPGFSPDYVEERCDRMDLAHERSDWVPTPAGQALIRNNLPLLAYIGGKPVRFTSKDHNFFPGETVEKQVIVINNSRETVACEVEWTLGLPRPVVGSQKAIVETGGQARIPLRFDLPDALAPGAYAIDATVTFEKGKAQKETQKDSFSVHVLAEAQLPGVAGKIAIFDPAGETGKLLSAMKVSCQTVEAGADLSSFDLLVVGKGALTVDGPGPDLRRVRDGLRVIVFEQGSKVLEQRLGFRVVEYGLRQVYRRVPDHPLLSGIGTEHLRDWSGEATILPPRLTYTMRPQHGPTVAWCGIDVTRAWRCGCRGSVASVLIEKPARGDFLPIVDGGFSLQYSPLMEYREGKGMVLFCQMDVTGRTEREPAAETLVRNILKYASTWKPLPIRKAIYVGDPAGKRHLETAGAALETAGIEALSPQHVLVVGSGGGKELAARAPAIDAWLKTGGNLLGIGLDEKDANAFLPFQIRTRDAEHIAAWFEPFGMESLLAGVGPADVHNRDPRSLPLVAGGASVIGDGVLARAEHANVVLCQLAPWQRNAKKPYDLKRTYRRTSFLVTRLLANMGAAGATPLLSRFKSPAAAASEKRWLEGLYLDQPEEMDDPYRFFRW